MHVCLIQRTCSSGELGVFSFPFFKLGWSQFTFPHRRTLRTKSIRMSAPPPELNQRRWFESQPGLGLRAPAQRCLESRNASDQMDECWHESHTHSDLLYVASFLFSWSLTLLSVCRFHAAQGTKSSQSSDRRHRPGQARSKGFDLFALDQRRARRLQRQAKAGQCRRSHHCSVRTRACV